MNLETPRLRLRPFTLEDAPKLYRMSREASLMRWLPSQVYRDLAEAEEVANDLAAQIQSPGDPRRGPWVLGVESKSDGELIGHVGLSPYDDEVEIGFAIEEARQGSGLATEAAAAVCTWALGSFGLDRILGLTERDNAASRRVLAHIGFELTKEVRMQFQGSEEEVAIYELASKR